MFDGARSADPPNIQGIPPAIPFRTLPELDRVAIPFSSVGNSGIWLSQSGGNLPLQIRDSSDKLIFKGRTNDERFDRNDHVTVELKIGQEYRVEFAANEHQMVQEFQVAKENKLISATLSASDE